MTDEQKLLFDVLTTLQKEIATNVLQGMKPIDAYRASSGKATTDRAIRTSVGQILSNRDVSAYLDSMRETAVNKAMLTREETLERLSALARTSLHELVEFGSYEVTADDGKKVKQSFWTIKNSALQTPAQLAAISELSTGKDGLKIKLHSPLQAIKQICDMQGWNVQGDVAEKKDVDIHIYGGLPIDELTEEELMAIARGDK